MRISHAATMMRIPLLALGLACGAGLAADCTPQAPSILGPVVPGTLGSCMKKGANIGPSSTATEAAQKSVRAQLDELLK